MINAKNRMASLFAFDVGLSDTSRRDSELALNVFATKGQTHCRDAQHVGVDEDFTYICRVQRDEAHKPKRNILPDAHLGV